MRKLPVYLLIDISGSMSGSPIQSVNDGIRSLVAELQSDPLALETVWLSLITFESSARVINQLTEIGDFVPPTLGTAGSTNLKAGIEVLLQQIKQEVKTQSATEKGDYKPMIFLMTDGQPDSGWEAKAQELKATRYPVIACAIGDGANVNVLKQITEGVVKISGSTPTSFKRYFKWVSQSIVATGKSLSLGQEKLVMAIPDDDIELI